MHEDQGDVKENVPTRCLNKVVFSDENSTKFNIKDHDPNNSVQNAMMAV